MFFGPYYWIARDPDRGKGWGEKPGKPKGEWLGAGKSKNGRPKKIIQYWFFLKKTSNQPGGWVVVGCWETQKGGEDIVFLSFKKRGPVCGGVVFASLWPKNWGPKEIPITHLQIISGIWPEQEGPGVPLPGWIVDLEKKPGIKFILMGASFEDLYVFIFTDYWVTRKMTSESYGTASAYNQSVITFLPRRQYSIFGLVHGKNEGAKHGCAPR